MNVTDKNEALEIENFNLFEFLMQTDKYGISSWVYYVLIYIFLAYIYIKVFRTQKLPILKSVIVYVLIMIGAFVLLIFQVDAGLPIVYSLGIAVLLMLIVKIRYFLTERRSKKNGDHSES